MFGPEQSEYGPDLTIQPTQETYEALQYAYEHFNWILFEKTLPNCLITLQRKSRSFGFFCAARMTRKDDRVSDEIALNPVCFQERSDVETLSTLVHEMVHLWQHHFGTPGRGRYHNRQWAEKMKSLGLQPTTTGEVGGSETGERVTHIIVKDGPFAKAAGSLIGSGFEIVWREERPEPVSSLRSATPNGPLGDLDDDGWDEDVELRAADGATNVDGIGASTVHAVDAVTAVSKSGVRVKYVCPHCEKSMWSSRGPFAACIEHGVPLVAQG